MQMARWFFSDFIKRNVVKFFHFYLFKVQFQIKWKGYRHKSWVKESLCDCDGAIVDFEVGRLQYIVG